MAVFALILLLADCCEVDTGAQGFMEYDCIIGAAHLSNASVLSKNAYNNLIGNGSFMLCKDALDSFVSLEMINSPGLVTPGGQAGKKYLTFIHGFPFSSSGSNWVSKRGEGEGSGCGDILRIV